MALGMLRTITNTGRGKMILPDTCVQEAIEANRDRICSDGVLKAMIEIAEIHLGILADKDEQKRVDETYSQEKHALL